MLTIEEKLNTLLDALCDLALQHRQSIPKQEIAQVLESLGYELSEDWTETD